MHLCACFPGWTINYVLENIDFITLKNINQYLEKNPPVHMMIASYFGLYDNKKSNNNNNKNIKQTEFNPMHLFSEINAKQKPFMNGIRRI